VALVPRLLVTVVSSFLRGANALGNLHQHATLGPICRKWTEKRWRRALGFILFRGRLLFYFFA
jgi:hypothetical protein